MASQTLVVRGGRLIDGTGRPPVDNAVIVIENGRFKAVGPAGQVKVPEGADIVEAAGRTVLPGFIDGHAHLEDFHGELYLHLGITTATTIQIFQDGPWTQAQKRGTAAGKIKGPRIWMSGRAIGGERVMTDAPDGRTTRGNITVTTPEEARAAVQRKKKIGCDLIKLNEFLPFELVKVIVDEAHSLDMAVTTHSMDAISSAKCGVDAIEHIWAVGTSSILYPPSREQLHIDRLGGLIDQEIANSYYQTENFGAIIDAMVANNVAWTPTIAKWLRPLSPSAERFRKRENEILNDPKISLPGAVRAVTDNAYDKLFKRYDKEKLERAKIGYDKANEFIRRFVEAGGMLKEGSDPPRGMAALLMHEALVMDVEAGVPPMKVLQAATLNVAKAFRMDKDFGSVEAGKVADLSIIEGDPLTDMWATQNVKTVVKDGAVIDISLTNYKNPIPAFYSYQTIPMDLDITPNAAVQGEGPITLKVRGQGIWPFHKVMLKREFGSLFNFNAIELPTTYISKSELQAQISPEMISEPGTYTVTVKAEGETLPESHRAHLIVRFRE
ncbi:MAG TPA: amidohydrolase family protein [Alphaproteobacteria bacterium]|nr:amidohydrolase family protein [Alphaproteobacteria bacterium]